jgi:uncharacterized protein (TIGR04255 family)
MRATGKVHAPVLRCARRARRRAVRYARETTAPAGPIQLETRGLSLAVTLAKLRYRAVNSYDALSMSTWPRLTRAPVVEALIDLRVAPLALECVPKLMALAETFAPDFPKRQVRARARTEVRFAAPSAPAVSASESDDGVVMRSVDDHWVVQLHLEGVTVSRLQPYGEWAALRAMAQRWWKGFCEVAGSQPAIRVATRFINRVPLPDGTSFDHTFATTFVLGPKLPRAVASYLLRCIVPFPAEQAVAVVTQALEGGPECLFDIDVFAEHASGLSESELWVRVDQLRELKNQVFFGSLTERAVESLR